ncbi:transketolase [Fodinicurvata sp. EGI_FJ10296]|uniref:transketolase n=1 Tax=Fodinicurvata sp. EGI_FJ10296 TaxID=3231908 RepID=UPI003456282A
MANAIRALSMDAVEKAKSGHPGMPMGMADAATVLWARHLRFDPAKPDWADRDRFVLSAGHGSMLLYSLLHLVGVPAMTMDQLKAFRQIGSLTPGHPEVDHSIGIETTTGPLGQGISTAVGMALAERVLNDRFGTDLVDHHTYVIASDGDLMEGVSHEACSLAGHLKLGRLVVLYDQNGISIDGSTDLSYSEDAVTRFNAYGWHVQSIDGHDMAAADAAIAAARNDDRPSIICCRTTIGFGAPTKAGKASAHGSPLGAEEIAGARKALGWTHEPFDIPDDIASAWRSVASRSQAAREAWDKRLAAADAKIASSFQEAMAGNIPASVADALNATKTAFATDGKALATRQASGKTLEALVPAIPFMIGGSADLTPSNNTLVDGMGDIGPDSFDGRYIRYGVREHAMVAMMNGMTLHGGLLPYGATFLTFTDYCRPAIRLAALMRQRIVLVMTHDSIGLGEDGPTHQPVEHVAALRAIPNLKVFRPADAIETAECWELALNNQTGPSVLALTRQGLTIQRADDPTNNRSARGAYVLASAEGGAHQATVFATGSEVEIAMDARRLLQSDGIPTRVVSMPSWELFETQDAAYRSEVLGSGGVRVAVEAAVSFGWERYIGADGIFIGMKGFGESGPYKELYSHFGITADAVAAAVKARLRDTV